jgi:hypothetical protein
MNNIQIKEKKYIKYFDKGSLNQSWSKWKLLIITMQQRNVSRE